VPNAISLEIKRFVSSSSMLFNYPQGILLEVAPDTKPIKHNFSTPRMKRKLPLFRCKELKQKSLRFGEKNECSSVCLHQPKLLFESSLLVVEASTSAIRRENIWLKTELEKT